MTQRGEYTPHNRTAPSQFSAREELYRLFQERPMPDSELLINPGLYTRSSVLSKLLFLDELYRQITPLPGVIMVFGTWWGQDVVVLYNLRAIHEPYNVLRKVIGFDTFEGYPGLTEQDRESDTLKEGAYHVGENYVDYFEKLMAYHNQENVMSHVPKYELVAGDVTKTLEAYFERHPETMVALAYLDLALYEPTKRVLELLKPRMLKGAVLAMDELNCSEYPGETMAFQEVFGFQEHQTFRSKFLPDRSYTII